MTPPVFEVLIGQDDAVGTLTAALAAAEAIVADQPVPAGAAMTHAWLFTGPAGSGRSEAARAFAAALQCARGGCGECRGCRTALGGTHADVRFVVPDGLTIGVADMRALVLRAASSPTQGRWQVLVVEDADRLTEAASNALLKAVEEPPPRTVFLLCAPSAHPRDISVTIRSRCRVVPLRQPHPEWIAARLCVQEGASPELAAWAASAAQGHVGRATSLVRDEAARSRRAAVLAVPRRVSGIGACFEAAQALIEAADAEAAELTAQADTRERTALETALGAGGTGRGAAGAARGVAGQIKELERKQKSRATRAKRDALDRALLDLAAFYRDALMSAVGAPVGPIHTDTADMATAAGQRWGPEGALRRIEAVLDCRRAIERNVKPQVAVESMMLALWQG